MPGTGRHPVPDRESRHQKSHDASDALVGVPTLRARVLHPVLSEVRICWSETTGPSVDCLLVTWLRTAARERTMRADDRRDWSYPHALHAILLGFPVALFAGGLIADITYLNTAVVQWSHFAAWLVTGALVFGALVLVWALIDALRLRRTARRGQRFLYFALVAAMWLAGLVNAFQHSRDAWRSVGSLGVILSIVCTVLALIAAWLAFSPARSAEFAP
jgi:uncharacterized membrane protein